MADEPESKVERLEELFIAEKLFGLTPQEEDEFYDLLEEVGIDLSSLGHIICALDVMAVNGKEDTLPSHLREKIRERASSEVQGVGPGKVVRQSRAWKNTLLPWTVAIAASILLLASVLNNWTGSTRSDVLARRQALIASATDLVSKPWTDGPTPIQGASGDVVWSPGQQLGYMRFRGMTVNNAANEQYQLWIFDRNQDEKTPVDGGVFDIGSDGEVVVEFKPKIKAQDVYLFAITIEKPGGVVVSDRSRLPLLSTIP